MSQTVPLYPGLPYSRKFLHSISSLIYSWFGATYTPQGLSRVRGRPTSDPDTGRCRYSRQPTGADTVWLIHRIHSVSLNSLISHPIRCATCFQMKRISITRRSFPFNSSRQAAGRILVDDSTSWSLKTIVVRAFESKYQVCWNPRRYIAKDVSVSASDASRFLPLDNQIARSKPTVLYTSSAPWSMSRRLNTVSYPYQRVCLKRYQERHWVQM